MMPDLFAAIAFDLAAGERRCRWMRLAWRVAEWIVFFAAGYLAGRNFCD
jgi:hypothetical protein